jgi:multimeric flavodoxin WrbA
MKAIVLHGSPIRGGSSDTLAMSFVQGLRESGVDEIQDFIANDLDITPCQGCLACTKSPYKCVTTDDDMVQIYQQFIEADVVIWATPMYWGYMTAQLKLIMDRMEASTQHFKGKTFVVILTYHYHYESTAAFFKRICKFFETELHLIIYHSLDDNTHGDVHVSNNSEKLKEAYQLGLIVGKQ